MDFHVERARPTTTVGFDVLWEFAAERQRVYLRRLDGEIDDLTNDPVLSEHRFTNAYRAADRVSQYLITEVIYDRRRSWRDTFARILVFKLFNRIDTWEYLVRRVGDVDEQILLDGQVDRALGEIAGDRPVYSAAYIMPPPQNRDGPKYRRHLDLLRAMIADDVPGHVASSTGMGDVFDLLAGYHSIGGFLAYQFATDLNYAPHLDFGEDEFVVAGPGALRGLKKCFADPGDLKPAELIRLTAERQQACFRERGLEWRDLWGRPLQLIDVQNLFCEVDKYTRVANPELSQFAPGNQIKQRYTPDERPLTAWFPPKWGINVAVPDRFSPGSTAEQTAMLSPVRKVGASA